jgi:CAAX prenyl protease-like protein
MAGRQGGYGWAPYWAPYLSFMLLIEIGRRAPESATGLFLALKVLVPGGLVIWYAVRGMYPELRGLRRDAALLQDVAIGLLGAVLWVAPFLLFDGLRPEAPGFDPEQLGKDAVPLVLLLRGVGYAAVTPFVEELFVRSWLLRYIDVFDKRRDFRKVPIARFTWRSFLVVVGFFVLTHQPWEWGVMLVWTLLTQAWFYHRGHILPLVIAHAATNGAIFAFVVLFDGRFTDGSGAPIPLWFFL